MYGNRIYMERDSYILQPHSLTPVKARDFVCRARVGIQQQCTKATCQIKGIMSVSVEAPPAHQRSS